MTAVDQILLAGEEPTAARVKSLIDPEDRSEPEAEVLTMRQWVNRWIDTETPRKSWETIKTYTRFRKHYFDYQDRYGIITPDQITTAFYDQFVEYLYYEADLLTNTVGITIKELKVFTKWLSFQGVAVPPDYTDFKILKSPPNIVYLFQAELQQYYEADLPEPLARQRDVWCFQASTGPRWSDLQRVNQGMVQDGVLHGFSQKNESEMYVPLNPMALEIYQRHDGQLPLISEQKYRDMVKEGMREAGLDRTVELVLHRANRKDYDHPPLWQVVATHTARKTFITHAIERGITPKAIAEVVGITMDVLTKNYYGTDKSHIRNEFRNKWK